MSFSIIAAGKIPDAIEQVKTADGYGDTSQMDAVKALIIAELEAWPANAGSLKGVIVEASGHHDATTSRSLSITIRPFHWKG